MKIHPSITSTIIEQAVILQRTSLENPGFCLECGAEADGCEPDAQEYECESCGERRVYGAEQILIAGFYHP